MAQAEPDRAGAVEEAAVRDAGLDQVGVADVLAGEGKGAARAARAPSAPAAAGGRAGRRAAPASFSRWARAVKRAISLPPASSRAEKWPALRPSSRSSTSTAAVRRSAPGAAGWRSGGPCG